MSEYAVIYERGPTSWVRGARSTRLRGGGGKPPRGRALIREAIAAHVESLREHGEPVPEPSSTVGAVEVPAA